MDDDDLIDAIRSMRKRYPDWRIGQMICNVAVLLGRQDEGYIWDMEDADFVRGVREHLARRAAEDQHHE